MRALFGRLHGVAKTSWGLRQEAPLQIYKSVFIPQMGYAASVWAEGTLTVDRHLNPSNRSGHGIRPKNHTTQKKVESRRLSPRPQHRC